MGGFGSLQSTGGKQHHFIHLGQGYFQSDFWHTQLPHRQKNQSQIHIKDLV